MKFSTLLKSSLVISTCLLTAQSASAVNNCNFLVTSKKWTLQGPCQTDETIVVPKGFTLEGQGFKITAKDPAGGNFQGAIITNGGSGLNISNLFLRTSQTEMADVCNPDPGKLVGILLDNTASTIVNVNITMNKGAGTSVCEEGVAIRAQATGASFKKVTIKNSLFNYNQLAGIEFVGSINGRVEASTIKNLQGNPVPQRGIVVAEKAKAYIINNLIIRHLQVPLTSNPSYGVLLDNAGQSTIIQNTINLNDYGIAIRGGTKITARSNILREQTFDGILMTDVLGILTTGNTIWANDSQKNGGNGIYLQDTQGMLKKNTVKNNLTRENDGDGIRIEGIQNKIQANNSAVNHNAGAGFFDITEASTNTVYSLRNLYTTNVCVTSSAKPPVNCP